MPRGNGRGRGGRGINFKATSNRSNVHDRLGQIPIYAKNNSGYTSTKNLYKFKKPPSSSVATIPQQELIFKLAKKFLKSYFELFDKPERINLESQYNADAFVTISATHELKLSPEVKTFGRNLLQVRDPNLRLNLLFHGKEKIARFMAEFLPTRHLNDHFLYDIPFYIISPLSVISIQVIVTGTFEDTTDSINPLKAFTRVFVLKQVAIDAIGEPKYEIFNDLFMIQTPTGNQIKKYHTDKQANTSLAVTAGDGLTKEQKNMITSIMSKTKMNREGSKQLLNDCNWDETKSMETFNAHMATNAIPQSFFAP